MPSKSEILKQEVFLQLLTLVSKKIIQIDSQLIKKHIKNEKFSAIISSILANNNYSCSIVYELCEDLLSELWGNLAPQKPLYYIYQYSLYKSFPNSIEIEFDPRLSEGCEIYLHVLKVISRWQKKSNDNTMQSKYPINLLSIEIKKKYQVTSEYDKFYDAFTGEFLYEMMKLNQEVVGHNTLDHICAVHYMAVFIAKQLSDAGLPVDLGRVSGAAAGHDLGKYGCRSWEGNRVAYLHYFYTDLWFKKHHITYIGHIALNHSVWDLELDNLSIESLILIYCDFRVKNIFTENNKPEMKIFTLKDSFKVILDKLDNVDKKKELRYIKVYNKLKDYEDFMVDIGIKTDINMTPPQSFNTQKKYYSLMNGLKITESLRYLSISHNIYLMSKFRNRSSLNEILETARSEKNSRVFREYLDVLQEYSTHFTSVQKIIVINFLYDNLVHPEEDIRRHCAELIGKLIATFDEEYRKEIPKDMAVINDVENSTELLDKYLDLFVTPDHKIIPNHRNWIGHGMKVMVTSLFSHCSENKTKEYIDILLKYYNESIFSKSDINLYLLDTIKYIPFAKEPALIDAFFSFIFRGINSFEIPLKISSLEEIYHLINYVGEDTDVFKKIMSILEQTDSSEYSHVKNYLKMKISIKMLGENHPISKKLIVLCNKDMMAKSSIFLSNLKSSTSWIVKKIQVDMLLDYYLKHHETDGLYTAIHFCNLLKVSALENVRNRTGRALVKIIPNLPVEQRNDVAIELLRALEIEGYRFTKYIPNYIGQVMVYLHPVELNELIDDLVDKCKSSNAQTVSLLLKTIGVFIPSYPKYKKLFPEKGMAYQGRLTKLLGVLLNALVHDDIQIRQIAFGIIGKDVFASKTLSLDEKCNIYQLVAKKILTLLTDDNSNELLFLTNSAGLNQIYRFISDYSFEKGDINLKTPSKVALFPGTFDPFTLSHKEITTAIRDFGFEVYLAVDEFSWSKRTQPNQIRKNIIKMSIANEMNIFHYPEDFPVNIANPSDLKELKANFNDSIVYIVAGSDVLLNASAYKREKSPFSILSFPHVIFDRHETNYNPNYELQLSNSIKRISAPVLRLNLAPQFEEISSTQIRTYIDEDRDISQLIDSLAQRYIYSHNLYRKEPQYKTTPHVISVDVEIISEYSEKLISTLVDAFHGQSHETYNRLKIFFRKPHATIIVVKDITSDTILAYSSHYWVPYDMIYRTFKYEEISDIIRKNSIGRIVALSGFYSLNNHLFENSLQAIITETLAFCLKNDYGYAVFNNEIPIDSPDKLVEILSLHGFQELSKSGDSSFKTMVVEMSNPCTLNLDLDGVIKEPFASDSEIQGVALASRKKLQKSLTNLFPGRLVLSFNRRVVDDIVVKKVCRLNDVPYVPSVPKENGELMCVPYGNILYRKMVPNTVTKSLHTEKMFSPNARNFKIGAHPYYLSLKNQVRMIKSFDKSIILVDDLMHKGYRMKALYPLLKSENINVKKVVAGIMSGRGKELMEIQNRKVDCAYFIPKLRFWFSEQLLYPFIGGDVLWRGVYPNKNLLPSINLILPYDSAQYIKGASPESIYNLSLVCIENSISILKSIERKYQKINERVLTMSLLSEVFLFPRCPDPGRNMNFDMNLSASTYLENDLELLKRLEYRITTIDR
ncbi:MAG: cytidyltransferase [Alkaliphilus sp.]